MYKYLEFALNKVMNIFKPLSKNEKYLKDKLSSSDLQFSAIKVGKYSGLIVFVKDIVDKTQIGELIIKPLLDFNGNLCEEDLSVSILAPEKKCVYHLPDCIKEVVNGNAILIVDGLNVAFSLGVIKVEKRAITEPPTATVIKGPREGFVESLPVNISLMRRRIKSPDLTFENACVLGKYTNTPITLCYIKGVADNDLVKKLKDRLNSIEIDGVLDSSYIAKFLGEHKTSLFKQVGNTEKPDVLTSKIMEGRVAIFVEGSPIAITVPYLLIEDFQSPSDYYNSPYTATVSRLIRLFSVILSIMLPAFFVSAELFHLQLIPLSFLITIVNSIKGIPLSPSYEMFFTILIFEILNETSVRMPKYVGMVVSIVGGLVLGETAVTAGVISAPTLMIVALSGICLYTVPELEKNFSLIRLIFLTIGGVIGVYGLVLASVILIVYLVSFENYSTPLFAPFSPLITKDLKDSIYRGFIFNKNSKPFSIRSKQKGGLGVDK
ncbi:MAG: spore germination protein [Clostridia bacterium]|nr:spore germination protein [Clostridia bacterium]